MNSLLNTFRQAMKGKPYRHRASTTGDLIASKLYDDLAELADSLKFVARVTSGQIVVNTGNTVKGKKGRRGDGTLGRVVPGARTMREEGSVVARGPVAALHIGAETKIIATKMIAQIDRVMNDLNNQASIFKSLNPDCITVAIVGVNHAAAYTGYEGTRTFDAKKPPATEAVETIRRLREHVAPNFDELLILRFAATNRPPFTFHWVDEQDVRDLYGSSLVRISDAYQRRF